MKMANLPPLRSLDEYRGGKAGTFPTLALDLGGDAIAVDRIGELVAGMKADVADAVVEDPEVLAGEFRQRILKSSLVNSGTR